jgi:hypothetical protein
MRTMNGSSEQIEVLEYAPPVGAVRRWLGRAWRYVGVALLLFAIVGLYLNRDRIFAQWEARRIQGVLVDYSTSRDGVVLETTPRSLPDVLGVPPAYPTETDKSDSVNLYTTATLPGLSHAYAPLSGVRDGSLSLPFAHERRLGDACRIVIVTDVKQMPPFHAVIFEFVVVEPAGVLAPPRLLSVYRAVVDLNGDAAETRSVYTDPGPPYELPAIRIWAGVPDKADESRFTFPYSYGDSTGVIEAVLDSRSHVRFQAYPDPVAPDTSD